MAAVGIDVDVPSLGADWSKECKAKLKQDLNSIVPELLAWHLSCDDTGQWFLKRRVPLFRYDYDKTPHVGLMFGGCATRQAIWACG